MPDGIAILRVDGGLFFANADAVRRRVREAAASGVRAVILDAESVPSIDVTAARMLAEVTEELGRRGTQFALARDVGQVRDVLRHADSGELPHAYPSVQAAVDAFSGAPALRCFQRRHEAPGLDHRLPARVVRPDLIAGVVVWSVVVPQCVAYAQIAGLPPAAGLMAAPGALIAYALLGTSRSLVLSATTATSAMSAAAVGPLAHGDAAAFAALSAALGLLAGGVLIAGGALRLGALSDFVSKPVMTGCLFGPGMTITIGQAPKLLGVPDGSGNFFPRLFDLIGDLGDAHGATVAVGLGSVAALLLAPRVMPKYPPRRRSSCSSWRSPSRRCSASTRTGWTSWAGSPTRCPISRGGTSAAPTGPRCSRRPSAS